jgi:release factor glutamine methyltransferase
MTLKSILEVLQAGAAFLERKGVESPRLNMEHLLAHALGLKRMDLYRQFDRPLSEVELEPLRGWTTRRAAGEPLQHLLGTVDFYRFTFKCDARALIPRPETEELVEKIIARRKEAPPSRILDMGCGSGVIGLSLAAAFAESRVILADASPEALALAQENATMVAAQIAAEKPGPAYVPLGAAGTEPATSLVAEPAAPAGSADGPTAVVAPPPNAGADAARDYLDRLSFVPTDLFSGMEAGGETMRFDVLAANLPYIPAAEVATLSREVQRDPTLALDGGEVGVELIERFLQAAPRFCAPGALVALEHGPDQGVAIGEMLAAAGFTQVALEADLSRRSRFSFGVATGQP